MVRNGPSTFTHSVSYSPITVSASVVEGVPDGADRGDRADVGEAFRVANCGVLAAGIGVMHDPGYVLPGPAAHPQRHLQGVQRQFGGHRVGGAPPTIRRENTSVTNAVNAIPDHVGTYVKSTTHRALGRSAWKSRCT